LTNRLRGNYQRTLATFFAKNVLGRRDVQFVEQTATITNGDLTDQPKAKTPEEARKMANS
jgi:hypothetical protein